MTPPLAANVTEPWPAAAPILIWPVLPVTDELVIKDVVTFSVMPALIVRMLVLAAAVVLRRRALTVWLADTVSAVAVIFTVSPVVAEAMAPVKYPEKAMTP